MPLAYALPATRRVGPRAWAGAAILAAGLALVGLGGCFMIGVLSVLSPASTFGTTLTKPQINGAELSFICVLYVLAFACFAVLSTLLFLGTRGLLRVMHEDGDQL